MSASYVKWMIFALGLGGALVLSGCAIGSSPDEEEGTSSSALESRDGLVNGESESDDLSSTSKIRPDLPRERPQLNLVPLENMASPPPSPWKGSGQER